MPFTQQHDLHHLQGFYVVNMIIWLPTIKYTIYTIGLQFAVNGVNCIFSFRFSIVVPFTQRHDLHHLQGFYVVNMIIWLPTIKYTIYTIGLQFAVNGVNCIFSFRFSIVVPFTQRHDLHHLQGFYVVNMIIWLPTIKYTIYTIGLQFAVNGVNCIFSFGFSIVVPFTPIYKGCQHDH